MFLHDVPLKTLRLLVEVTFTVLAELEGPLFSAIATSACTLLAQIITTADGVVFATVTEEFLAEVARKTPFVGLFLLRPAHLILLERF